MHAGRGWSHRSRKKHHWNAQLVEMLGLSPIARSYEGIVLLFLRMTDRRVLRMNHNEQRLRSLAPDFANISTDTN